MIMLYQIFVMSVKIIIFAKENPIMDRISLYLSIGKRNVHAIRDKRNWF